MQIGATTMENSLEVPQKIKNRTSIRSSNSTFGYLSKENKNTSVENTYALPCSMHHFLQQPRYGNNLSAPQWTNKKRKCDIYTVEYYAAIKKKSCHLQQHGWNRRAIPGEMSSQIQRTVSVALTPLKIEHPCPPRLLELRNVRYKRHHIEEITPALPPTQCPCTQPIQTLSNNTGRQASARKTWGLFFRKINERGLELEDKGKENRVRLKTGRLTMLQLPGMVQVIYLTLRQIIRNSVPQQSWKIELHIHLGICQLKNTLSWPITLKQFCHQAPLKKKNS